MMKPLMPFRVMYVYAVIGSTLFVMAFFWLIWNAVFEGVRSGIITHMSKYENQTSYEAYTLADIFFQNLWAFFLAIMIIGLLYWAIIYSQRKGRTVMVPT